MIKERLTSGWTFQRIIYLILGSIIIIQSAIELQWFGIVFGTYFASMGLFAFGCASGNCFGGNCESNAVKNIEPEPEIEIEFEEIKK